jgi:ribosomal protein S6--L-glutamate ligase
VSDGRYLGQRMPMAFVRAVADRGVEARVLNASEIVAGVRGADGDPWAELRGGDAVVARTRNSLGLALLRAAERDDVAVLPRPDSVAHVRNKARAAEILAARRIPTPQTFLVDRPAALKRLPTHLFPLVLKPHLGDNASGIVVVSDPAELDDVNSSDGLVVAQEYVDCGSVDLKLYGVGDRVWAVRRPSPLTRRRDALSAEPMEPRGDLESLARACAEAFDLELYGVDMLLSKRGPLVVDVNEFPNYTGVEDAPDAIADLVCERLPVAVTT